MPDFICSFYELCLASVGEKQGNADFEGLLSYNTMIFPRDGHSEMSSCL